jgi:hypothetical protein
MTPPPYALPLRIRKAAESFVVEDAGGVALAYVYFEEDPSRRGLVNRLAGTDARADHREGANGRRRRKAFLGAYFRFMHT